MTKQADAARTENAPPWLLSLLCLPGMGPVRARQLLESTGCNSSAVYSHILKYSKATSAPTTTDYPTCLSFKFPMQTAMSARLQQFQASPKTEYLKHVQNLSGQDLLNWALGQAHQQLNTCASLGIRALPYWHPDYPTNLKRLPDYPLVLYTCGNTHLLNRPAIAIVGTRSPSPAGLKATQHFSQSLSSHGYVITSGLAHGIDTMAHLSAVKSKSSTIAVLGCGLDIAYPKQNKLLLSQIFNYGVAISEYPPQTLPLSHQFVRRNRLIASLSQGVVVVESQQKGGALITANWAKRLRIPLYAFAGLPHLPTSQGPLQLIREGACSVSSAKELLQKTHHHEQPALSTTNHCNSLSPQIPQTFPQLFTSKPQQHATTKHNHSLTLPEEQVLNCIGAGKSLEEIRHQLSYLPMQPITILWALEQKGLVTRKPGSIYCKNHPIKSLVSNGYAIS